MGARVVRKYGKGKGFACRFGGRGRPRAASAVRSAGYRRKRCSAGRAADRAKRERAAPPPGQAAKKAALSLPSGGTNGCRKSGARHRWQDGWVKKEVRPGGRKMWKREGTARRFAWAGTGARHPFPGRRGKEGQKGTAALRAAPPFQNPAESRLRRAQREASPRRPCKSPQTAASDEPIGKHRRGDRARYRWQDGWVKKEVRPGGRKMWKREGTARRFAWAGTGARGKCGKGKGLPAGLRERECARAASLSGRMVKKEVRPGGGERRTKGNGGAARSAAVRKPRGKPPQTSPSGSIASAALQNPVEGRLRRALRRASPRRPWKSPRCSRPQRGCSRGRSPPRRRRWRRGC